MAYTAVSDRSDGVLTPRSLLRGRGPPAPSDRTAVFAAAAVAEAPDPRVGVRHVVDGAARKEPALAAVELVGAIARELERRLILEQAELVAVALPPELAERVDDPRLQHRHVP